MRCLNGKVAVAPFAKASGTTRDKTGFINFDDRTKLIETRVVFGTDKVAGGVRVWLNGSAGEHPEAQPEMGIDGQRFVLIPESLVVLVEEMPEGSRWRAVYPGLPWTTDLTLTPQQTHTGPEQVLLPPSPLIVDPSSAGFENIPPGVDSYVVNPGKIEEA